ncbi:MAG: GNAT family N-acetyltransferase [Proteobacteria bacterium]|nr:GNAT family N-acetyltransferase [Pseudomonadota bacterium]
MIVDPLDGALDGNRTVGLASAAIYDIEDLASYPDTWAVGDKVGEIKFLAIADNMRGRGVGTALTQAIDRDLAKRGVHDRFVGAVEPNRGAIRLYESRGFRPAWLELTIF